MKQITDVDSFPPHFMEQYTRDPLPKMVVWDLSTRAPSRETEAFYYLTAPYSTDQGVIYASYDPEANVVAVNTQGVKGEFGILLNEEMIDFTQPVTVVVNDMEYVFEPQPDRALLVETTADRGDRSYQFEALVSVTPVN